MSAVFGLPLYNAPEHLGEALDSLLAQTDPELSVVMVDDSTDDRVEVIARRYAAADPRVHYERNPTRLGLTRNWQRAFERATELAPDAEFFAWASDHDWWHPRWLEVLGPTLAARPDASAALPMHARIVDGVLDWHSAPARRLASTADTSGLRAPREILHRVGRDLGAGTAVYGLFRVDAIRQAGGFRRVLLADRLLLAEAALRGPLVGVDETLLFRRVTAPFSLQRQRAACFPDGAPAYSHLPWWATHAVVIAHHRGLRRGGVQVATAYAAGATAWDVERSRLKLAKRAGRFRPQRLGRRARKALARRIMAVR